MPTTNMSYAERVNTLPAFIEKKLKSALDVRQKAIEALSRPLAQDTVLQAQATLATATASYAAYKSIADHLGLLTGEENNEPRKVERETGNSDKRIAVSGNPAPRRRI